MGGLSLALASATWPNGTLVEIDSPLDIDDDGFTTFVTGVRTGKVVRTLDLGTKGRITACVARAAWSGDNVYEVCVSRLRGAKIFLIRESYLRQTYLASAAWPNGTLVELHSQWDRTLDRKPVSLKEGTKGRITECYTHTGHTGKGTIYDVRVGGRTFSIHDSYLRESMSVGDTYEVTFTKRPLLDFNVPFSEHVFTGAKGSVDRLKGSIGAVVSDTKHAQVKPWSAVDKVNGEHVRTKTSAEILKLLEEVPASRKAPVTITFVVGLPPNRTRRRAVLELRRKPNQATRLAERMASVTAEMDVS